MASVNHTRPHCLNQMGKTHSKPLAVRHGRGTAWARHGHGMQCVNRPSCDKRCISQDGVLPPVAMQVILMLEPSLYGPSIWCGMMVPLSPRIKSFSGGTETNNEYIVIKCLITR